MLKEICTALLEADVNVKLVGKMRQNVRYRGCGLCVCHPSLSSQTLFLPRPIKKDSLPFFIEWGRKRVWCNSA